MPDPQRDRANMAWPRAPYRIDVMRDELLEGDVHETMLPAGIRFCSAVPAPRRNAELERRCRMRRGQVTHLQLVARWGQRELDFTDDGQ